jgi:hypothetical protein
MRPLFVDFPDDARSWAVEDEFLLARSASTRRWIGSRSSCVPVLMSRWPDERRWNPGGARLTGTIRPDR